VNQQVLLLNSTYEPLHICHWKRAIVLLLKGKAVEVERNGKELGHGLHMPLVIKLGYYVKVPRQEIPYTRKNLMHRDDYTCQYCGNKNHLTLDHVMPRSRGGKDDWDNVVTACVTCNVKKGSRTPQEAEMPLKHGPKRPFNFVKFELSKQQQHQSSRLYLEWEKYLFH
jgi:5-methylcytosine-specific restriction endonuclease McrA